MQRDTREATIAHAERERDKKSDCFRVKLNDSTRYTKIFSSLLLKMMHSRDEAPAIAGYKGIVSIELMR